MVSSALDSVVPNCDGAGDGRVGEVDKRQFSIERCRGRMSAQNKVLHATDATYNSGLDECAPSAENPGLSSKVAVEFTLPPGGMNVRDMGEDDGGDAGPPQSFTGRRKGVERPFRTQRRWLRRGTRWPEAKCKCYKTTEYLFHLSS